MDYYKKLHKNASIISCLYTDYADTRKSFMNEGYYKTYKRCK